MSSGAPARRAYAASTAIALVLAHGAVRAEDSVAVLVDVIKGDVSQSGEPLQAGSLVGEQAPVTVGGSSWVALLSLPACKRTVLRGPGRFLRRGPTLYGQDEKPMPSARLSGCDKEDVDRGLANRLSRAGAVVVREEQSEAVHVAGLPGAVFGLRPSFAVSLPPRAATKAVLRVRDAAGRLLGSAEFEGPAALVSFPARAAPLKVGQTYLVDVEVDGESYRKYLRTLPPAEHAAMSRLASELDVSQETPSLLFTRVLLERGLKMDVVAICAPKRSREPAWAPICAEIVPAGIAR
jgi:hypothetical protein